jgi:diguanylate cyclase
MALPPVDPSLTLAQAALERIRQLGLRADPASFEFWYAYESGKQPALNSRVEALLAQKGVLTAADLDPLYAEFLCDSGMVRIETASSKIRDEVDQIVAMIEAAIITVNQQGEELDGVRTTLAQPVDRGILRLIIESLVHSNKEIEQENSMLGASLRQSRQQLDALRSNLQNVRIESLTDPLTTLPNRRSFDDMLDRLLAEARTTGAPLTLMLADIDHFKQYNDRYGHQTGDFVLRLVGLEMKRVLKDNDVLARYGGEEFAVILPGVGLPAAMVTAELLRRGVADKNVLKRSTGETLGRVTVSIGIAEFDPQESAESLIARADRCLYEAKMQGRNCVVDQRILAQRAMRERARAR